MELVFFDLDHTLIKHSTGSCAIRYFRKRGQIRKRDIARGAYWGAMHYLGIAQASKMMQPALRPFAGWTMERFDQLAEDIFEHEIRKCFYRDVVERLQSKRDDGAHVAILSASFDRMIVPIAKHLDVPFIGTEVIWRDKKMTTQLVEPMPYHQGKIHHANRYADSLGANLQDATFYSDSSSDIPLLDQVGTPIAVNPDPRLRRHAKNRGWEIVEAERLL